MKLSVVSDEVSADLETALELLREWEVGAVELRGIGEVRFPEVSDFWRVRVPELIRESGHEVAALSPGLFKIPYPAPPTSTTRILRWEDAMLFQRQHDAEALVRHHLEVLLPESISAAKKLGAPTVVCFSFDRVGAGGNRVGAPEAVIDVLRDAARTIADAGLTLAIEVEHICWGDTGARTAELIRRIDHPAVGINWDPANAYRSGEDRPYPDGYDEVRDHVRHVHFKDAYTDAKTGARVFGSNGVLDWDGQIAALLEDGYEGFISVETHDRPKIATTRNAVERLRALGVQ